MASIVDEIRNDREKGAKLLESEYKAGLMSLARRFCSDESDAEELVNRTFAIVIERIDSYLEQSAFFGWMSRILVNCYSKDVRRKSNEMEFCDAELPEDAQDEDASARVFREVDASILRDAIDRLPKDMKQTLLMHYFMDMPVREVAKVLSVPSGTIMWRLHYARKILGAKLGASLKKPVVALVAAALFLMAGVAAVVGVVAEMGEIREAEPASQDVVPASTGMELADKDVGDGALGITRPTNDDDQLMTTSTQKEETTMQTTSIGGLFRKALRSLAAMATTATMASAPAVASTAEWTGEGANALNSASYVKVMENTGPLAGTWTLTGITAWNGSAQVAFACVSNRPYAAAYSGSVQGALPAGNYVHQLSVFNQWDGSRTRSYRVQLAQPVGGNDIYARVTAVTVSQEGENLVDYPDIRDFKDDATKIAYYCSTTENPSDLANFPITKLKFKKQTGYIQSNGARDACVNTGYYPGPNTRVEFDFELTELEYPDKAELFGSYLATSTVGGYVYMDNGNKYLYCIVSAASGSSYYQYLKTIPVEQTRRCIVLDYSAKSFEVWTDGVSDYKGTLPQALHNGNSAYPMSIIGSNYKSWGSIAYKAYTPKMKVYGCRIYEAGVLVKNFIPCVRGGIPGFKETCAGVFVGGNVASLTTGGDIWTDPDDPYVALDYPGGVGGNLPAGTRLYFSSNDTIGPNSRIEFDYSLLTHTQTGDAFLFDSYGSKRMAVYASGGHYAFTINDISKYNPGDVGDVQYMLTTNSYGIRRTVVLDKDSIRFVTAGFTNVVKTVTSAQSGTNNKFVIGNRDNLQRSMPMRIYGCRIYDGDVLQKDYRPGVTNGVPGLYDALSGVWRFPYTNSGTGSPIAKAGGSIVCTDGSDESYLEFPGTGSGIDTGYRVTPTSRIEADFALWNTYNLSTGIVQQLLYQASGTYVRLDAAGKNSDGTMKWLYSNYVSPFTYHDTGVSVSNRRMQYVLDGSDKAMTLTCGEETLYNEEVGDWATSTVGNPNNLIVGKSNAHMRLYGLKIWEYVNDVKTPVRDFVPCVTNGVAGLYDLCESKFYPLSGGKVSGKTAVGADEFVTRPQPTKIEVDRTGVLSCFSAAAKSYEWYVDGEKIDGETGETLTIDWVRQKPHVRTYSVVPVYEVFGETVRGKAADATVEFRTNGMTLIIR